MKDITSLFKKNFIADDPYLHDFQQKITIHNINKTNNKLIIDLNLICESIDGAVMNVFGDYIPTLENDREYDSYLENLDVTIEIHALFDFPIEEDTQLDESFFIGDEDEINIHKYEITNISIIKDNKDVSKADSFYTKMYNNIMSLNEDDIKTELAFIVEIPVND